MPARPPTHPPARPLACQVLETCQFAHDCMTDNDAAARFMALSDKVGRGRLGAAIPPQLGAVVGKHLRGRGKAASGTDGSRGLAEAGDWQKQASASAGGSPCW